MLLLRKPELINRFIQAISEGGWQALLLGGIDEHPVRVRVFRDEESFTLRVYIWNITHGGGKARPSHEYRIQVTGVNRFEQLPGERAVILGWYDELGVFAGFDYRHHTRPLGHSPSLQIKEECLRNAYERGFAPCPKGSKEIALAFRPDFAVHYLKHLHSLHDFGESDEEIETLESFSANPDTVEPTEIPYIPAPRQPPSYK